MIRGLESAWLQVCFQPNCSDSSGLFLSRRQLLLLSATVKLVVLLGGFLWQKGIFLRHPVRFQAPECRVSRGSADSWP